MVARWRGKHGMKTIVRRLRKLEEKAASRAFIVAGWVSVLRERRRRRAEAAGVAYVEPVRVPIDPALFAKGRWPSWAEVLRSHRARRHATPSQVKNAGESVP